MSANRKLQTELDRTRNELRAFQSAFAAFKTDEYGAMARKVEELTQESMEMGSPAPNFIA